MRVKIAQLHQSLKEEGNPATMIYVTHDQTEALTLGDRICVLNLGKIMQVDTPANLYNYPANKFVASFIGSPAMNLIDTVIREDNGPLYIEISNGIRMFIPVENRRRCVNTSTNPSVLVFVLNTFVLLNRVTRLTLSKAF